MILSLSNRTQHVKTFPTDTCGSASMLPKELGGVVDPQLKVYGTKNIRVVDLSILPLHISVHPQGECMTRMAYVYSLLTVASPSTCVYLRGTR